MSHELGLRNLRIERQRAIPVIYKGMELRVGYRLDLIVDDAVVVEVKAVEAILPVHEAQVITYLKLSGYELGLLVNFHTDAIRNGLRRFVHTPKTPPRLRGSV